LHWWFGILILVLVVLFLETRGEDYAGCNFFVSTDSDSEGAQVIVDGKKLGVVSGAHSAGIGGGAFWGYLTRGKHVIQLVKPAFEPFSKEIVVQGEAYLGVDLKRSKN
jgi:hypothetical protein